MDNLRAPAVPSMPRATTSDTSKAALIARQIRVLLSAYRRDDYSDPDAFVAQLGTVLTGYSEPVIMHVTSPQTGLQRTCKFPPSIAEVVEACEAEATRDHRRRERRGMFAGMVPAVAIRGPSMESRLCAKFGIRAVPHGWDAVEVYMQARQHGENFRNVVESILVAQAGGPAEPPEAA